MAHVTEPLKSVIFLHSDLSNASWTASASVQPHQSASLCHLVIFLLVFHEVHHLQPFLTLLSSVVFHFSSYRCAKTVFRPRRSGSAVAYSRQTFPWTICRSVGACVHASVCPVHCGKTADRIRMPFGIIGRTDPGMRQVVGFGDLSTGRGTFGGAFGARHCNQWDSTTSMCDTAWIVGAAVWGGEWCVRWPRHCCIRWGST